MIRAAFFLVTFVYAMSWFGGSAWACPTERPDGDLVVALRGDAEPFSFFDDNNDPAGFAYDLWKRVERSLQVPDGRGGSTSPDVTFVACNSIDGQEVGLVEGRIDVVIAPLTITARRMQSYDFSQQYLSSGLTLAQPPSSAIDFEQAKNIVVETFLHPTVAQAVVLFLTFNLVMAFLIRWVLFASEESGSGRLSVWLKSLLESIIRTIGLRGVGDEYSTAVAKVLEIFLAVVGTALSATLLGVLTSAFVGSVGGEQRVAASQLTKMKIVTLDCSTAQELLRTEYNTRLSTAARGTAEYDALQLRVDELECNAADPQRDDITVHDDPALDGSVKLVASWRQAANLLIEGEVDGVLGDWIALTYLSRQDGYRGQMAVLPSVYRNEPYGWGISRASVPVELRREIDRALIREMRKREWRKTIEDVLGTGSVSPN